MLKLLFASTILVSLAFASETSQKCQLCLSSLNGIDAMAEKTQISKILARKFSKSPACTDHFNADRCRLVGEKLGNKFVQKINEFGADKLCTDAGMCLAEEIATARIGLPKIDDLTKCYVCRIAFNYFAGILNENATAQLVEKLLRKACAEIQNETIRNKCDEVVYLNTPKLMVVLVSEVNTLEICKTLTLCKPDSFDDDERSYKIDDEELDVFF